MRGTQKREGGTVTKLPVGQRRKGTSIAGRYVCRTRGRSSLQSDLSAHISRVKEAVFSPQGKSGQSVKLTTRFHLASTV
jgi:hypothetical protein